MPTQEERLAALEQTTKEYRPVLHNFAYELAMVKGLIIDQTGISQELRGDVSEVKKQLDRIETRLDRLDQMEALLTRILDNLPKRPTE
ncbi:hypothetical protein KDA_33680 [Dictyobacter alpinus]|uniref:Uncharacterized protein n=1 Tax=Dictyobacter alpinus TaxID=2014873 RepID=A0A402B935_9CHLR|nr:hypothetical protein [Dictyobacter alpinus]GCE27884.1 hypothetical protein KDA_33680 [Dictyobacter alpinus]